MRVLLVSKTTNFELHGETLRAKIRAGLDAKAVLDLMAQDHSDHTQTLNDLTDALAKAGADVRHIGRSQHWPAAFKADVVMTVGGDGTLLAASHRLGKDDKLLGFKSSRSSVGYLCVGDRQMIPKIVARLFAGTLEYVSAARLAAKVTRAGSADAVVSEPVLNDILFVNANPAATTRYMLHHDKEREEHRSSGIWFSTAIGSSAGIRAAGGERVPTTARLYQFRVRELYRPSGSRLHLAGGYFDENSGLRVQNFNESGLLALDGQHGAIELSYGDEFVLTAAPPIQIASLPETSPTKNLGFLGANFAAT